MRGLQSNENIFRNVRCKICAQEKVSRAMRPMRTAQSMKIFERIYSDVLGPVQEAILGGSEYFVSLIDKFIKFSAIRIVKANSKAAKAVNKRLSS